MTSTPITTGQCGQEGPAQITKTGPIQPAISFDQCLELFKEMKNAPIGAHVATEEYRSLLKALYQRMEMDVQMVSYEGREG